MTFFKPAVRDRVPLLIGLTSGTGGGKTYSALRIATGIAGPGKRFAAIDTERGRMSHYADYFAFDVVNMAPPFSPQRMLETMRAAEKAGYPCLVTDSMSHEWQGEGGVLDMHEAEVDRMARGSSDWKVRDGVNFPAWRRPKEAHRDMVEGILQLSIPLIMCFRGKAPIKPGVDPQSGKKVMIEMPYKAITDDNFPFEMTVLLVLSNAKPGQVDMSANNKISRPVRPMIRDGQELDEAFGASLAAWARGGGAAAQDQAEASGAPRRTLGEAVSALRRKLEAACDQKELDAVLAEDDTTKLLALLTERKSPALQEINGVVAERLQALAAAA